MTTTVVLEAPAVVFTEEDLRGASGKDIRKQIGRPGEFRGWLHARMGTHGFVGYPSRRNVCPLAVWLQEVNDDDSIEIRKELLTWRLGAMPLPHWMQNFVMLVDYVFRDNCEVSARAALHVLEHAEHSDLSGLDKECCSAIAAVVP